MKSKYVILILTLILFQHSVAVTIYYPPQATHNWHQGASVGTFTTSITDSRIYLTTVVSGSYNYVVTDQIDLSNISTLAIDWAGTFDAAIPGNITFGISTVQADASFDTLTKKTTTFSRTTTHLDVTNYYGLYYLKFGINVTSGFPSTISSWLYNVQGYNHSYSYPLYASSVEETTATLQGYLLNDSNYSSCTCGFWVYNQSTNASNAINFTAGSSYGAEDVFTASATNLNASTYYYVRTWSKGRYGFNISSNESYFLTKPESPTGLSVSVIGPSALKVSWTNATMGNSNGNITNQSVYIRYSNSSYPTTRTSGTFGCNVSKYDNYTFSGLSEETTYYFSAWTYINASGSPEFAKWSDSFATATDATVGGALQLAVRYENESISGNLLIDLSEYGPHKLVVHYENLTQYAVFSGATVSDATVYGYWAHIAEGNFTIIANNTVKYIEFTWNYTDSINRCHRILIPTVGENTTFYVRTNLPVYGETLSNEFHSYSAAVENPANDLIFTTDYDIDVVAGVYVYNASLYGAWVQVPNDNYSISGNQVTIYSDVLDANSTIGKIEYYMHVIVAGVDTMYGVLVPYIYTFSDPSTIFVDALELDAYVNIYTYNSSSVRLTIHQEFFTGDDKVNPMLIGCKKYFLGVGSSVLVIDRVCIAPTRCSSSADMTPEAIDIPQIEEINYSFFDIVNLKQGWRGDEINGFYVYYQDTMFGTNYVNFTVWDQNGTAVYWKNATTNTYNFTYALACKKFRYNYTLRVGHEEWTASKGIEGSLYPGASPIFDIVSLNDLLEKIFGNTPLQNFDTGETVPWAEIFVGSVAMILLLSFSSINGYVGMISTGAWLCIAYSIISGLPIIFFVGGMFLISMAFVFAIGGRN